MLQNGIANLEFSGPGLAVVSSSRICRMRVCPAWASSRWIVERPSNPRLPSGRRYYGCTRNAKSIGIAEKQEEKIYVQVAYLLNNEKTIEREFGNLMQISDNFPKMVLSMDEFWQQTSEGIIHKNIIDFLREE